MASFNHLLTFRGFYTHGSLSSQLITRTIKYGATVPLEHFKR
jgi:hypothetical protein